MKKSKKFNWKKFAIAATSVVAIGGSLAGGFAAGTKSTENKYAIAFADQKTDFQKTEEDLKKAQDDLQKVTQDRDGMKAELQALKENGRPEDADKISELEESIQSKEQSIKELQEQIKQIEEQADKETDLRPKFFYAFVHNESPICVFGNLYLQQFFSLDEDPIEGSACVILYDAVSNHYVKVTSELMRAAEELDDFIYCFTDDGIIQINKTTFDISKVYSGHSSVGRVMLGTDANGEECLVGLDYYGQICEVSKNGEVSTKPIEDLAQFNFVNMSKRVAFKSNESSTSVLMYENGQFVEKATFDFPVFQYAASLVPRSYGYVDQVCEFPSSTDDRCGYFNEDGRYFVAPKIGYCGVFEFWTSSNLAFSVDDSWNLFVIDFDNMRKRDLDYKLKYDFTSNEDLSGYENVHFLIVEKDSETLLVRINNNKVEELFTFESGKELELYSMSASSPGNPDAFTLRYRYVGDSDYKTYEFDGR